MSEIQEPKWYVVHTYSGHENKVKATIEKAVKTREMEDCIKQVIVPTEDVIETTKVKEKVKEDGKVKEVIKEKTKVRQRKIYPSYVLIKMIINFIIILLNFHKQLIKYLLFVLLLKQCKLFLNLHNLLVYIVH